MAELVDELFDRQKIALVGFDVVFAEPDESSGLKRLRQLAQAELKDQPGFAEKLGQLQAGLDYDAAFAKSLQKRPVVMGYYLTNDKDGRTSGVLPEPVMQKESLRGRPIRFTTWNSYGSNIEQLAKAAPMGGFFNSIVDPDGVVRSVPLLAEYKDQYYESLALAMFRVLTGLPSVEPGFPPEGFLSAIPRPGRHPAAPGRQELVRAGGGLGDHAGSLPRPGRGDRAARTATCPRPTYWPSGWRRKA